MTIQTNSKGTRSIEVTEEHLATLRRYTLFSDLLDSHGIVDESDLEKLRLNARSLLERYADDTALLALCQQVLFHDNMKAFGLHELIMLYLQQTENP